MAPQDKTAEATQQEVQTAQPKISVDVNGMRTLTLEVTLDGVKQNDVTVRMQDGCFVILNKDNTVLKNVKVEESVDPFTVEAGMQKNVLRISALLPS